MTWSEDGVYRRIGEFVVSFQWVEDKFREIGWFILDPDRRTWPPRNLRSENSDQLAKKVWTLILDALPKCRLDPELERDFREAVEVNTARFVAVRKARNRILHSAFHEHKAGGEVVSIVRSHPRLIVDNETGEISFDQEPLTEASFATDMREMAELALFLNRCYLQLVHRLNVPAENGPA